MAVLANPAAVLKTRKNLVVANWTEAQQQVEELGLGTWETIRTDWEADPLYANIELRTPVLLIGTDWVMFINGLYE